MNETLTIDSARAAAAFEHPQSRRILLQLVAGERSLQDLARNTGLSLSLLHYHVGRLRSLGLVRIAKVERRSGRPVKRYRVVAASFFVPAGLATNRAGEALARELRAGLEGDRARRDDAGVAYSVDDSGGPRMSRVRGRYQQRAFEAWITLALTSQEAEELAAAVRALFARYSRRGGGGARPVLAYCAFAETRPGGPRSRPSTR